MSNLTHNEAEAQKRPTSGSTVVDRSDRRALPTVHGPRKASEELRENNRKKILSQTRFFTRNDGLLKEIKILFATYAIGQGLKLQLGGGDDEWKKKAYALWEEWCELPEITGRFTMAELETFCCNALGDDGDIFLALIYDPETKGRPWVQIIESHQVGGSGDFENGVVKNPVTGQPTHYIIRDDLGNENRYDANSILHLALFERYTSDRGTPDFETAVAGTYDRAELERLVMTKAQNEAAQVQVITQDPAKMSMFNDDDEEPLNYEEAEAGEGGEAGAQSLAAVEAMEGRQKEETCRKVSERIGGQTLMLDEGLDMKSLGNYTPGNTFDSFINHRMLLDSMGLILLHFFCPEKLGGASLRAVLSQTDSKIVYRRQMPIIRVFKKLVRWWLACMIDNGSLPFVPDFDLVDFQTPARITADYGRDAKADRDDLAAGIQSYEDNFQGRGLDFRTQMLQNIEAREWLETECRKRGLNAADVFPIAYQNAAKAAPQPAPAPTPAPPDQQEPANQNSQPKQKTK